MFRRCSSFACVISRWWNWRRMPETGRKRVSAASSPDGFEGLMIKTRDVIDPPAAKAHSAAPADVRAQPLIEVKGLFKRFGHTDILRGIDLSIAKSEVVCIIGPSGSGKSTLLRCIAGLETYDHGDVRIESELLGYVDRGGRRTRASTSELNRVRRNVGMVFQQFNLWPHMTVIGNVREALLRVRGMPNDKATAQAGRMLDMVGLSGKADAYPSKLSGG